MVTCLVEPRLNHPEKRSVALDWQFLVSFQLRSLSLAAPERQQQIALDYLENDKVGFYLQYYPIQ